MIKKFKQYLVAVVALVAFAAPMLAPVATYAATPTVPAPSGGLNSNFCSGVDLSLNDSAACDNSGANDSVNNAVKLGLNLFSAIVGIISVVMIIMGGIRYITSGGDSGKVTSAQNTVLYAVIGLVVVALAQIIVKFVLNRFTS